MKRFLSPAVCAASLALLALCAAAFAVLGAHFVLGAAIIPAPLIDAAAAVAARMSPATAVQQPNPPASSAPNSRFIATHLYELEKRQVKLQPYDPDGPAGGGAIEAIGEDLMVATPLGRLAIIRANGDLEYQDARVPMNHTPLQAHDAYGTVRLEGKVRVADILLKERGDGGFTLFAAHHYFDAAEECIRLRLSSTAVMREDSGYKVSPDWRTIFDAEPCLGFVFPYPFLQTPLAGGKMLTDGDCCLLIITGDHAWNGEDTAAGFPILAQDPTSHLGKLIRVNIESGAAEILTLGHRNPQGFARDGEGRLWAAEHGPLGGDELNLLRYGENYGWPLNSYGFIYGRKIPPPQLENIERLGTHGDFARPSFSWTPAIAPSALIVNDARAFPYWKDDLLVASLNKDSIYRVRRHGDKPQYVERINFNEVSFRIRDMAQTADGRIALMIETPPKVVFISRSDRHCPPENSHWPHVYSASCDGGPEYAATGSPGEALFNTICAGCHIIDREEHLGADKGGKYSGPHLVGVMGRRAGSADGYPFSDALSSLDMDWTRESLRSFIANSGEFAPGTKMRLGRLDPEDARAIADYLAER